MDAPNPADAPAPLSPDWYRAQLAAAERVLAERESALAARATPEYAAWREVVGVVNTLKQLVLMLEPSSEAQE